MRIRKLSFVSFAPFVAFFFGVLIGPPSLTFSEAKDAQPAEGQNSAEQPEQSDKIAWHGTWAGGLAEAKRTGRPIMLVSAAPHCHRVSGVW